MTWAQARERFALAGDAASALEVRTVLIDELVRSLHGRHLAAAFPEGLAVLAVGGFGRRELFPHSDIDLLFLVEKQSMGERQREALSAFLRDVWDSGARLSHSVHTPAECCELDDGNVELSISLLDQRFIAGDVGLYGRFSDALPRFLCGQRQTLLSSLCRMARERHAQFQRVIYHLEPNIKDAPGGLRDYQLLRWAHQLQNSHRDRVPAGEAPAELDHARDYLRTLRCFLHLQAGRDSNVLTFDLQEAMIEQPGLTAVNPAAAMREYYRNARDIHREAVRQIENVEEQSSSLLVQFRDWRSRVSNSEFFVSRERVFCRVPHQIETEPEIVLRLFQFVARHGLKLARETERRIASQLARLRHHFAEPRPLWPMLSEMFALPHAGKAVRAMHELGVLTAIFPEWERIECLVVRDFYHRYTVDEHTLVTLETLAALRDATTPAHQPFRNLLSEAGDFPTLVFALLFHDTGKASRSGEHVAESALLADAAAARIGMPAPERRMAKLLIERHLDISSFMTTRDLDDPATARCLADRVGAVEDLKLLTLLTYADISAVSPTALTPWRLEQLWRAYVVTYNELTRELHSTRIEAPAIPVENLEFLEGLPVRYVRTHTEEEIAAHLELYKRSLARGVAVEIEGRGGCYYLTLIAPDRPALLASIAGALAGFGMNILKAEGFANRRKMVLDTFAFSDPHRTLELNPTEAERLRIALERVALGKADVKALLKNRPKPPAPGRRTRVAPAASFDSETSASATLIQVVAEDRPGLLYSLASALCGAGCDIELVLVDTQAQKAIDVFYVTIGGRKLSEEQQGALRQELLYACLG